MATNYATSAGITGAVNFGLSASLFGAGTPFICNIRDVPGTETIRGIGNYTTRVLGVLSRRQCLLVPAVQLTAAEELLDYLRSFGLSDLPPSRIIPVPGASDDVSLCAAILQAPDVLDRISVANGQGIQPFVVSREASAIAKRTGKRMPMPLMVSRRLNDKAFARKLFQAADVAAPMTFEVSRGHGSLLEQAECAVRDLRKAGYAEFALTRAESCSGQGIRRFRAVEEIAILLDTEFALDERLLVEGWVKGVVASPSFQVVVGDQPADDVVVGVTDQILKQDGSRGPVHAGNVAPSVYCGTPQFDRAVRRITNAIRLSGGRGLLGVDLMVTENGKVLGTEVNARETGAVYGGLIARKLGREASPWLAHNNVLVSPGTTLTSYVDHLEAEGVLFTPGRDEGVVVVSNGNLPSNKMMILCLATRHERLYELLDAATTDRP